MVLTFSTSMPSNEGLVTMAALTSCVCKQQDLGSRVALDDQQTSYDLVNLAQQCICYIHHACASPPQHKAPGEQLHAPHNQALIKLWLTCST